MPRPLTLRERELLFDLECELPSMRQNLDLAKLVATHPLVQTSPNPVIGFAFTHAAMAVVGNMVLRVFESVELLDRAAHHLATSALLRPGRSATPVDRDFAMIWRLRHEIITHRIKLAPGADAAFEVMSEEYGDYFVLLYSCLDKLADHVRALRSAGLLDAVSHQRLVEWERPFTFDDVTRVVAAANELSRPSPDGPPPAATA